MIILSLHNSGWHDACAVVADDYEILSAVQMERLTRRKGDGRIAFVPEMAQEALRIAGKRPHEVRALVVTRSQFLRHQLIHAWWKVWRAPVKISARRFGISMARRLCRIHRRGGHGVPIGDHAPIGKHHLHRIYLRAGHTDLHRALKIDLVLRWLGLPPGAQVFDCDHHFAHALPCLFFTEWDEALLYTADGGGDTVNYSMRHFCGNKLRTLYGGFEMRRPHPVDSMGSAYGYMTQALGYRINRHEGKLTGLAAYGEPAIYPQLAAHFSVSAGGRIHSDFATHAAMQAKIFALAATAQPQDAAASIQKLLEESMLQSMRIFLRRTGARNVGLGGGVFANVALNRRIAELPNVDEVFIFPGMGDEGLAVGGLYEFLLRRDGLQTWLARRRLLCDVYWGGHEECDAVFAAPDIVRSGGDAVARLLAAGRIVALYCGRMEFGPRALGGRSILANPSDAAVNDTLNRRLGRTEFMPFAPFVLEEDVDSVFEAGKHNRYAMRFMTITCKVRDAWRKKIPAVVHVDGSARPQIICDADHPLYAGILRAFKKQTGLPVLINTSFNAHEEPIINTPQQCLRALRERRVDYVATKGGLYRNARHENLQNPALGATSGNNASQRRRQ
ncbi:MAG: hypothetical protein OD918_04270 [Gammaproteobacteria bacterium]